MVRFEVTLLSFVVLAGMGHGCGWWMEPVIEDPPTIFVGPEVPTVFSEEITSEPVLPLQLPTQVPYYRTSQWTRAELERASLRELSLMRNTIYARVGNPFNKAWLKAYFESQPWYVKLKQAELSRLTEMDHRNAALIADVEANQPREKLENLMYELSVERDVDPEFCCEELLELQLVSAALGEWWGDDSVPSAQRNPLEDPRVLDQRLVPGQIRDLSRRDLRLLRNSIFARHGRAFKSPHLIEYFAQKVWYEPDTAYTDARLSAVDKANITMLRQREDELGGPMTDAQQAELSRFMVAA